MRRRLRVLRSELGSPPDRGRRRLVLGLLAALVAVAALPGVWALVGRCTDARAWPALPGPRRTRS